MAAGLARPQLTGVDGGFSGVGYSVQEPGVAFVGIRVVEPVGRDLTASDR